MTPPLLDSLIPVAVFLTVFTIAFYVLTRIRRDD